MNSELLLAAQAHFERLVDLPENERESELSRLAAADGPMEQLVRLLLANDARVDSFLSTPAMGQAVHWTTTAGGEGSAPSSVPLRVGNYDVVRPIGEGGMGAVYEAWQDNPRRTVAVKVIRPGLVGGQVLSRFRREAEMLGKLHHPGIAAVYEAGVADIQTSQGVMQGQPFFAMELVQGKPLLDYCNRRGCGTRERLEILAMVCDAVQHAHAQGVVHRDLKPGNVLVDETGRPKVLDFGIARAVSDEGSTQHTQTGQILGTVPYMSPEQITADRAGVDARSDVYALGVIMFELLAGRLPYDLRNKPIAEAARIIRDTDPTRLASASTSLRGDVDTIVSKALEKDPLRRYQSAAEMGDDIRRFLGDQPILARPPSTFYQLSKFARRNKALVGGTVATIVVLAGGIVATSIALGREAIQRASAESNFRLATIRETEARQSQALAESREKEAIKARRRAEQSAEFSRSILSAISPSSAYGRDTTLLRETLGEAAARVEKDLADLPDVQADMLLTIGETYRNVAAFDEAAAPLRRAVELRRSADGPTHPLTIAATYTLAGLLQSSGEAPEAAKLLDESIKTLRAAGPESAMTLVNHLRLRADLAIDMGKFEEGGKILTEALALAEPLGPSKALADVRASLGSYKRRLGQLGEAEALLRSVLEFIKTQEGDNRIQIGSLLNSLAVVARTGGRMNDAEALYKEVLDIRRKLYDRPHPDVAIVLLNLGKVYTDLGRIAEAEPLLRESLEMHKEIYPTDHQGKAIAMDRLAMVLMMKGESADAEAMMSEAIRMFKATVGPNHPFVGVSMSNLGNFYLADHRSAEAEEQLRGSLAIFAQSIKSQPEVYNGPVLGLLGDAIAQQGRYEEALEVLTQAKQALDKLPAPNTGEYGWTLNSTSRVLLELGRVDEAAAMATASLEWMARSNDRVREARVRATCVKAMARQKRFVEAEKQVELARQADLSGSEYAHEVLVDLHKVVVELYELWEREEPGQGHANLAAQWKQKLDTLPKYEPGKPASQEAAETPPATPAAR